MFLRSCTVTTLRTPHSGRQGGQGRGQALLRLTSTAGAPGGQGQPQVQPGALQVLDKLVHHLLGVVRRGGDPQLLLAPGHGGEVDGLDVVTVALEEHVRQGGAESGVTHVDRDDVGGRGLHSHSSLEQGRAEIADIGLVAGPQLPALLRPQDPHTRQGPGQHSRGKTCSEDET